MRFAYDKEVPALKSDLQDPHQRRPQPAAEEVPPEAAGVRDPRESAPVGDGLIRVLNTTPTRL